jgi:hypothetical protein
VRFARWQLTLGLALVVLSALLYTIQYAIFHTPGNIVFYLFQDLAFLPIEVLLVALILNSLLNLHEKRERLKKMNMVIGAFFSEVGAGLIERLSSFIPDFPELGKPLCIQTGWTPKQFAGAASALKAREYLIDSKRGDLSSVKCFLFEERVFLLRLLENPNLLEHDTFTDLLWAVFHLADELDHRNDLTVLPETDFVHLSGDMKRAFTLLVVEWLAYMQYLKTDYPYLFSLAVRTNPFDPDASVIVR